MSEIICEDCGGEVQLRDGDFVCNFCGETYSKEYIRKQQNSEEDELLI